METGIGRTPGRNDEYGDPAGRTRGGFMHLNDAIYLFKSSGRPLYRQQNLHLLAAERGAVVELAWNRSWVAAEYFEAGSIAAGAPVVLVLTDRPYALFVPVRAGEVVEARWEELSLRLWIALGTWLEAVDGIEAYSARLRAAQADALPGEKFVAPRRDDAPLDICFDAREDEGWTAAVDGTLALSAASEAHAYSGCVFFRPAGLRIAGNELAARHEPIPRGSPTELLVRFHNPHLTTDEIAELELRALAEKKALRVQRSLDVSTEGTCALEMTPFATTELTLQVAPEPAHHTSLTLRLLVRGDEATDGSGRTDIYSDDVARSHVRKHGPPVLREPVLDAWHAFRNASPLEPAAELPVVEAFARALPDEYRVLERRAVLLALNGEDAAAFAGLRELEPERLDDEARFLLFRLHTRRGNIRSAMSLLDGLDLREERRLDRLLAALSDMASPELDRMVHELSERLEAEALAVVLEATATHLTLAEHIAAIAMGCYVRTSDATRAAALIQERTRTLHLSAPVLTETLLDLADAGGIDIENSELGGMVEHRLRNLFGRGDDDDALALLGKAARRLPLDLRARLFHFAADRLLEREKFDEAADLLIRLAYATADSGDLLQATDAAERAGGLYVSGDREVPPYIATAIARVEAAWRSVEDLEQWRTTERERRAQALRARYLNRCILIAGGFKRDRFEEPLQDLTGAQIEFGEHFRTEGDSLGVLADRIRSGRYALVVLRPGFSSHVLSDTIKRACEAATIPLVYTQGGGLSAVEQALWRTVDRA